MTQKDKPETAGYYPPELNDGRNIFVFGSNLIGRHGRGAALDARLHWGALSGAGWGRQGKSYAIPTKDEQLRTLPLHEIGKHIWRFLDYATAHPELRFLVTAIGCGLAGYQHYQVAPFFTGAPANCVFPPQWCISGYEHTRTVK